MNLKGLKGGQVWAMSNIIVKENETLDSALRRFKRSCAKAVAPLGCGVTRRVRVIDKHVLCAVLAGFKAAHHHQMAVGTARRALQQRQAAFFSMLRRIRVMHAQRPARSPSLLRPSQIFAELSLDARSIRSSEINSQISCLLIQFLPLQHWNWVFYAVNNALG